jgi:hypothetical protein
MRVEGKGNGKKFVTFGAQLIRPKSTEVILKMLSGAMETLQFLWCVGICIPAPLSCLQTQFVMVLAEEFKFKNDLQMENHFRSLPFLRLSLTPFPSP